MTFPQPNDDRIKNHRQKKNQREKQNHRLKRAQNQPDDDQQEDEPDDAPRTVITQRTMLIFILRFFHDQGVTASQPSCSRRLTNHE